ncbi:glycosyltransferase [Rudaea cellulosilytica]|uniref:glycosyltransferase n=1 Tax=Rudaea cellulosilytica TaxID=540746 RepID=UPI0003729558|nr:glycosyltransferase [Rudaea cellulosilytica]
MSSAARPFSPLSFWRAAILAIIIALANIALWAVLNRPSEVPEWDGKITGIAYNPYQRFQGPNNGIFPTIEEIDADLKLLATRTDRIRTYSSIDNPAVPALAKKHGIKVLAGTYLDRRWQRNEDEISALIEAVRQNDNIDRVTVGNETLHRQDMGFDELVAYIDRVRAQLPPRIQVSTAEPPYIWRKYPKLAEHVDFITAHPYPYWEKIPRKDAVGIGLLGTYVQMQSEFPGKKILIGEVGWPSAGDRNQVAVPSVEDEAQFIRQWVKEASWRKLDYYIFEAFDQPWKESIEGRVGAYWGIYGADRQPKFSFTGKITEDPTWPRKAIFASLLALLPMFFFARHFMRFKWMGVFFFCALIQLSASLLVWSATLPLAFYLSPFDWTMLVVLFPAQLAIILILLINGFEFTEVLWHKTWLRGFGLLTPKPEDKQPFVSIHLAACNEPPEMVILTLDSLAALDYENFEVLVIDNNTKRDEVWKPVEEYCAKLGPKFRFFHLNPWPGFKAGALNYGLEVTDPRAEVIAVVDADYAVRADWLKALTGYFNDPKVAVVQCPQAHRDWEHNEFRRMTNWEYDGFFRIGMHHRNERNAIIQHGTMTMVRRDLLESTGKWSEWTICEDAELGLRLMHAGYELNYVDEVMGRGLTPADFTAYKSQRYRWAFGAMQILKGRWKWMTRKGPLTAGQRFHFLTGWFSWFADALHMVFSGLALWWTAGMLALPKHFALPLDLFIYPIIGFFVFKAVVGIWLYRVRVPCSWKDTIMASIASMGLSHAIARGIFLGLWKKKGEFVRTAKSRRMSKRPNPFTAVREELLMFIAIVLAIAGMLGLPGMLDHWINGTLEPPGTRHLTDYAEGKLWIFILAAQAIPYLSALIGAMVAARSGEKSG